MEAKVWKAMAKMAEQDAECRYALAVVAREKVGESCEVVATDGKRLAWYRDPAGHRIDPGDPIPVGVVKTMPAGDWGVNGVNALDNAQGAAIPFDLVEARFPEYRDMMPKEDENTIRVIFNGRFLADAAAFLRLVAMAEGVDKGPDAECIEFVFHKDGRHCAILRHPKVKKAGVLVMPVCPRLSPAR